MVVLERKCSTRVMSVVCDRACRAQLLKFWSKVMYVVVVRAGSSVAQEATTKSSGVDGSSFLCNQESSLVWRIITGVCCIALSVLYRYTTRSLVNWLFFHE